MRPPPEAHGICSYLIVDQSKLGRLRSFEELDLLLLRVNEYPGSACERTLTFYFKMMYMWSYYPMAVDHVAVNTGALTQTLKVVLLLVTSIQQLKLLLNRTQRIQDHSLKA
jgi:hypothetical protein